MQYNITIAADVKFSIHFMNNNKSIDQLIGKLLSLLSILGILSACGQIPQPFSKNKANISYASFLIAPYTEGVLVCPVFALPDAAIMKRITTMTVKAIQKHGIPASSITSNRASLILIAEGKQQLDEKLRIKWTLKKPNGKVVALRQDVIANNIKIDQALDQLACWIMPKVSCIDIPLADLTITINKIIGATGNGNDLLHQSLTDAIKQVNVNITKFPAQDGFVIQGTVTLTPNDINDDLVVVSWSISDARGRNLGSIKQSNVVAHGALLMDWSAVASQIATAAVPALLNLIRSHLYFTAR
ncbi:hypothetical protein A1OE_996 [Candidatus Endolissoclinum faulkneri L2]|uniref:Uncharacterized protein n=1 Tax=Candidatus Endolissoclinum faulkneri L2 TaxID=1193729 RepID=K7YNQ5_9PROT|nr:hypothetical protein [Candidatus Endolissoclinum faulkneri]AFX99177.1 hypothetical protein A1OE_996 [Candidatus Endolissoclinum faulkneri L2]